jgi:poly-gamma-glutamate capsule biosynthesis protein CapA/YwtB (metallophosphatase superfamily)
MGSQEARPRAWASREWLGFFSVNPLSCVNAFTHLREIGGIRRVSERVDVRCYAGGRGEETPRRVTWLVARETIGRIVGVAVVALVPWLAGCTHGPAGQHVVPPQTSRPIPTSRSPQPVSFTLAATGDLLLHEPVTRRAKALASGHGYDFRPLLADVRPILSVADLAICHMETPLSRDDRRIFYWPSFNAPHEIAPAARWAGYDTCTTASNHTLDQGSDGVRATLDALDAAHLQHVGTARSPAERSWRMYRIRGVRVAHLDYTYGLNGIPVPSGKPWLVNLIDPHRILADAHAARRAGAQFVIVALHWGQEYQSKPTAEQRALARTLLASPDIDLVYGCHVHVVQPVERIGGKYVVYGLGNFLARHAPCCDTPPTRDGMILQVTVTERHGRFAVSGMRYTPTYVDAQTIMVLPVARMLRQPGLAPPLRQALLDSWQRTVTRVDMLGAARLGVAPDEHP